MARAVRRADLTVRRGGPALALPALVGASTLLHWLAARRVPGLWIMPDEAIYAERALAVWRDGSLPVFRGAGAGYGLLYPIVAGLPLSVGSTATGLAALKLLQALVMSLAAAPVFLYGRRIMPPRYALLAAALTITSPLLLYSGLVMTEVVFYPVAAATLLAVAHAVETARRSHQLIALAWIAAATATRTQAVVFVAILAAAALADSVLAGDRRRWRSFWPAWVAIGAAALAVVAAPDLFGSYAGVLSGGYPVGLSLRLTYYHLAYLALSTAVLPFAALAVLSVGVVRRRESDRAAAALIIVTACAVVAVCAQIGMFSARFAPHLLGRDLAALPPLLFLVFALWLARGLPRPRRFAVPLCFALLATVILAPWDRLVVAVALPDSFGASLLYDLSSSVRPTTAVSFGAVALFALFLAVPRRIALILPLALFVLLVATSVSASNLIATQSTADQDRFVGAPRDWVDQAVTKDVTYLYGGEPNWNGVWQQRFWNRRLTRVLSLAPARVPGPMPQHVQHLPPNGRLAVSTRYVLATDPLTLVGTPVERHSRGADLDPLTLWRVDAPARLSMRTTDIKPNGDILSRAAIEVYDCAGGTLGLTLLPKATDVVTISLDGSPVLQHRIAGLDSWYAAVRVPESHRRPCRFTIHAGLLLGTTVRAFARP